MHNIRIKQYVFPLIVFLCILFLWHISVSLFNIPEYIIPSPYEIALEICHSWKELLEDTSITMFEAIVGFVLGSGIGILLGIVFVHSRVLEISIYPYAIALRTVPIVAIAPLLILWFGTGLLPKIVMAALLSFFPAIVNSAIGLKSVNPQAINLMKSLSASKWQILIKLRLPNSLPYIFAALKVTCVLSVIGAIVGELAGSTKGIGYSILVSSYRLETSKLFAAITASSLGGILFFQTIRLIEKRLLRWHESEITI